MVKTLDGQHLLISHHKSRKEAEERRELEMMLLVEWVRGSCLCETWVGSNYNFKRKFPNYAGFMNYRHVHPEIQEKLDKVNNE